MVLPCLLVSVVNSVLSSPTNKLQKAKKSVYIKLIDQVYAAVLKWQEAALIENKKGPLRTRALLVSLDTNLGLLKDNLPCPS